MVVTILVFGQTLTLHPAVTALVESSSQEHNLWTDKFFLPVTCFLVKRRLKYNYDNSFVL